MNKNFTPPKARTEKKQLVKHNDVRIDDYYWLRDRNNPEVIRYLNAENTYTDSVLKPTEALQESLYKDMRSRIKEKNESYPVFRKGYYYYTRTEEGREYYKYCRKKGSLDAPEEILLDVDAMAEGHAFFSIGDYALSPDNNWLVYGVDTLSRRQYDIFVKNLKTGAIIDCKIKNTSANYVWLNDNQTFLYITNNPETLLTEKVYQHKVGEDTKNDVLLYTEKDKTNYLGLDESLSEKYIFLTSAGTLSSEVWYKESDAIQSSLRLFSKRQKDVIYNVDHQEERFVILTNWNAKNYQLMETPLHKTDNKNWKTIYKDTVNFLRNVNVFKNCLVLSKRNMKGLTEIHILDGEKDIQIPFQDEAYVAYVGANVSYELTQLRYAYTSMIVPFTEYDYNIKTGETVLLKRKEVPNYNPDNYVTKRWEVTTRDGVKVPVSVVYKKGTDISSGKTPLLLYAYGSYGNSMDPGFSSARTVLLDKGFVYALAHIRGGRELGQDWYENGKLLHKKNTFFDFIDVAKEIIRLKYTSTEHLYAQGGSAGGLLMGAIVNLAPELFNGVIAQVPFVDVLTTMLDASIPLTTNEYDEWGNPEQKKYYDYIKSYSPYDNVIARKYPNLLVTTGLYDSQVQYWEPAKWVAKLRAVKTDNNILLLKTNMKAGHGGSSGRFSYLKEIALNYAFLLALEAQYSHNK